MQLNALAESIRSKSKMLQAQCRQGGFGPLTKQALEDIEAQLGRSITRLRLGSTQADWDRCAEQYAVIIEDELKAKLKENRYLDKIEDISHANDYYVIFSKMIEETLSDKTEIKQVPEYVENLINAYRDSCTKATALLGDERKSIPKSERNKQTFHCDENYSSPNIELGTFSHTFKSAWATKTDGGTLAVILISLFIDFIVPLALYLLVRSDSRGSGSGNFWSVGPKKLGPTITH